MEEYLSILWMEGVGGGSSNGNLDYNYNHYGYGSSSSGSGGGNDNMGNDYLVDMIVGDILVDSTATTTTTTTTASRLLQSQTNRTISNLSSGIQMIICLSMYGTFL